MSDTAARAREQRIAEIRERERKASKGPWKAMVDGGSAWIENENETVLPFFPPAKGSNVDFVIHARADIPFLLEQLAAQSAAPVEEVAREIAEKLDDLYGESWTELDTKESLSGVIASVLRQHGYGAQGQGVGPRCPKCGSTELDARVTNDVSCGVYCRKCRYEVFVKTLSDYAQFFSLVPAPESATKEGK